MLYWELEKLLRERFDGVRAELTKSLVPHVALACKRCGWTITFRSSILDDWTIGKDALTQWLLRHVACK